MPKLSQLEQLDAAIKNAAKEALPENSSLQIAEDFLLSHRDLIDAVADQWLTDKLASLIRHYRAKSKRANDRQRVLQERLGFGHIPRKVEVRPGESIPIGEATRKVFRKLKVQLRKAKIGEIKLALEEADRVDAIFARYTKKPKTRYITFGEIIEKEAEKAIQQGLFDPPGSDESDHVVPQRRE